MQGTQGARGPDGQYGVPGMEAGDAAQGDPALMGVACALHHLQSLG